MDKPIAFRGDFPDDPGVVDGNGETSLHVILISSAHASLYFDIINLEIRGGTYANQRSLYIHTLPLTDNDSTLHVNVVGCVIHSADLNAVRVFGSNVGFQGCDIYDANGDAVYCEGNDISFIDCRIHDFGNASPGDGIQLARTPGFMADGDNFLVSKCTIVYDQTFSPHKQCIIVGADDGSGAVIEDCLLVGGGICLNMKQAGAVARGNNIFGTGVSIRGINMESGDQQKAYGNTVTGENSAALIFAHDNECIEVDRNLLVGDGSTDGIVGDHGSVENATYTNNTIINCINGLKVSPSGYRQYNNLHFNNVRNLVNHVNLPP